MAQDADAVSAVQNAILEGVSISAEKGSSADEKNVTCYFIFKDKPSSYFFNKIKDPRTKERKIVFEFNDTKMGQSPISYEVEPPITSFKIDSKHVDANATVKGLTPEWHDILVITLNVSQFPKEFSPSDQYNIISFSYKWSTDPNKVAIYAESEKKPPIGWIAAGGVVAIGAGVAAKVIFGTTPTPTPAQPLSIDDLPSRP